MMRRCIYIVGIMVFALTACRDGEVKPLFDKSADERTADAIASLKTDLTAPVNGYKLKYNPTEGAGSYHVLIKFNADNTVRIRTDLAADDKRYFDETLTYRIDSGLGLELIMETYCFFGFLYQLDQASFGGEYQFIYASKTPDNALVFVSKTDPPGSQTRLVFEPAAAGDDKTYLSTTAATNLATMVNDLDFAYAEPFKITYDTRDLILYMSMDDVHRTISIGAASRKANTNTTAIIGFETAYTLNADSIVFDTPLKGTYVGLNVSLRSIKLDPTKFTPSSVTVCTAPITTHVYRGVTSAGEAVALEPTFADPAGAAFTTAGNLFSASIYDAYFNGEQAYQQLQNDISGVTHLQIYLGASGITGIGFRMENKVGDPTYALWNFSLTRTGNKFTFTLGSDITLYENPNPDADIDKVKQYILDLTNGGNIYVFKVFDRVYELYNPCTGWSYTAVSYNQ